MKAMKWVVVAAACFCAAAAAQLPTAPEPAAPAAPAVTPPAAVNISPAAAEVLRLSESGVGEEVVLAYVKNSQTAFSLTSEDVLYLRDVGLSSAVLTAMLARDTALRAPPQGTPYPTPAPPEPPSTAPAPGVSTPNGAPPSVEAAAPAYSSDPPPEVNYFYNDLSPYGTWAVVTGVGWCWQPRAVVIAHGWRPYCNGGHWVFSDCGWFWQSDYSWGWAPFHYGRWYQHGTCGWVWCPDRVWGPSWVTWRVGGAACGWAPLPPHTVCGPGGVWSFNGENVAASFGFGLSVNQFTFVATKNFTERSLAVHTLPPAQARAIFYQTTIINNYTINNHTVINKGIGVGRVAAATGTEVPRAMVRDLPIGSTPMPVTGKGGVVYRHEIAESVNTSYVMAQKVNDQHSIIWHAPITPTQVTRTSPVVGAAPPHTSTPGPAQNSPWMGGNLRSRPQQPYAPAVKSNGNPGPTAPSGKSAGSP
jgi:hypothetical protein